MKLGLAGGTLSYLNWNWAELAGIDIVGIIYGFNIKVVRTGRRS
jgi:hypothetical protein